MSARDYQHKRFRARGTDSGGNNDSAAAPYTEPPSLTVNTASASFESGGRLLDKTPPRVVTPHNPPSPAREVHNPTATNGSLTYISPLKPDKPNMRYSLNNGIENPTSASAVAATISPDRPENPSSLRKTTDNNKDLKKKKSSRSSSSKLFSSSLRKHDPSSYKIFLLLLQPKLKTFELIQLIYSPNDTTIGNIIEMIPENATEPALGNQVYCGVCRPKTQEEISDMDLLASESHSGVVSAKITLGEILVAIPHGYTGADVSVLAKQILANPKIVKLLKRADPLAPKKSRRSSRRHRSSRRSRSKEHVEVMEQFNEEDEIKQEQDRQMKEAMKHAQQEAAAANARIPGGGVSKPTTATVGLTRTMSIASVEDKSVESSLQESLDDSYSSWSKSFDASFASSVCSGVSKRQMRRRERQVRRSRILKRAAGMAFIIMLALYFLDPRGYGRVDKGATELITDSPMGFLGVFQCLFLLLSLYKIERLIRTSVNPDERSQGKHRCPFLKAADRASKKFKARYAKKLKKPVTGRFDEDEQSLSRKLRSFSLKASAIRSHDDDELTQ